MEKWLRFDWREIASRLAMLLVAALSLLGAAGLYHFSQVMAPYNVHGENDDGSGPALIGAPALLGAGGWLLFSALRPKWKST
jgi:hypothetical protein